MKLVPIIFLPLAGLRIWLQRPKDRPPLRHTIASLLLLGFSMVAAFVLLDILIESGAYLLHFRQSWISHFGAAQSTEHGSAVDHPFAWSIFIKHWDATVPALVGIIVLASRLCAPTSRSNHPPYAAPPLQRLTGLTVQRLNASTTLLPLAWLGLSLVVFAAHKPWWPYYYIHTAIPLAWCAAIGIERIIRWFSRLVQLSTTNRSLRLAAFALALAALCWISLRLYFQIADTSRLPRTHRTALLTELERFRATTKWLYTQDPIYSFYSGIPMPPSLAVMPLKRYWCGDMTDARLAAELKTWKPGLILVRNSAEELLYQHWLDAEYRVAYRDPIHRLYVPRGRRK